jgi:ATP-dependent DNA helicase PIF1
MQAASKMVEDSDELDLADLEMSQQALYGEYNNSKASKPQLLPVRRGRPINVPWAASPPQSQPRFTATQTASQSPSERVGKKDTRTAVIDGQGWRPAIHPTHPKKRIIVISDDDESETIKPKKLKTENKKTTMASISSARMPPTPAHTQSQHVDLTLDESPQPRSSATTTLVSGQGLHSQSPSTQQASQLSSQPSSLQQATPRPVVVDLSSNSSQVESGSLQSQEITPYISHPTPQTPVTGSQAQTQPYTPSLNNTGLVDHRGRPLSNLAIQIAREYWKLQREYELLGDDQTKASVKLLSRIARHRRTYTELILGAKELTPGSRTYEPPQLPDENIIDTPTPPAANTDAPQGLVEEPPVNAVQQGPVEEPLLNAEQQRIVELAASGKNIFYTGSAGCGKSTVLNAIKKRLIEMGKTVHVMAPTGKVALAINGTTTWMYAGWNPDSYKRQLYLLERAASGRNSAVRKRFRQTDVIIIDEISMVENLHFERLNAVMKAGRYIADPEKNQGVDARQRAFGGVQVIVTGDFCQLPPVKPFGTCMHCGGEFTIGTNGEESTYTCVGCNEHYTDSDKWAFRSKAWKECNFISILLKSIHRQNDHRFIAMLQKCRMGVPFTERELDLLMNHNSVTANAVKLFSTREEVRRTNDEAFRRLKTEPRSYRCYDKFIWHEAKHPNLRYKGEREADGTLKALSDHRLDRRIDLKIGMLVVLVVNLDLSQGFCNGSQGVISGFEPYDVARLPRKTDASNGNPNALGATYANIKEAHIRTFADQQKTNLGWPVVRFLNGKTRTIYPECQVNEVGDTGKPYSLLCRTQVPLIAAWALSIHKAQGMTLNRVIVNLSRAFEEGQVYVALSRATSLEGLKVEGDLRGLKVRTGGNKAVRAFLRERFGE